VKRPDVKYAADDLGVRLGAGFRRDAAPVTALFGPVRPPREIHPANHSRPVRQLKPKVDRDPRPRRKDREGADAAGPASPQDGGKSFDTELQSKLAELKRQRDLERKQQQDKHGTLPLSWWVARG
jgi:hypothetical protein